MSEAQDQDYLNRREIHRQEQLRRVKLLQQIDTLDSEIKLNYELCRELEHKRAVLERELEPV